MPGTERVRSCDRCQHRVYNLSEMTSADAADLLRKAEGRICVRFYQRSDGTIMTRDCPAGLQAVRQRTVRAASLAIASVGVLLGAGYIGKPRGEQPRWFRWAAGIVSPENPSSELPYETPVATEEGEAVPVVGRVALPMATMGVIAPTTDEALPTPDQVEELAAKKRRLMRGAEEDVQPSERPDPFVRQSRSAGTTGDRQK
ncbi:MAG: hypothetical protein SFU56_19060 [Capsulimonadales bacterium]|nr:hypothetical protein [Capsulimonadales bacterium]